MPLSFFSVLVSFFIAVSAFAAGVQAPSVVAVDGQKADCHGTFIFSGTSHDLLALPASCLQNIETGGVRVFSPQSKSVRSVGAAIHPYLEKNRIYDMAKVPPSFDFAVALFPKGTAEAVSPVSREYAQSLSGYYTQSADRSQQSFYPDFQKQAEKSATDLEPDTSVLPGAPVFDATNRGVVAIGLGCTKTAQAGTPQCMAVSLHDSLSRDVLAAAKKRYPGSLAALELPSKTHQLGHLGLFCRRRPSCPAPARPVVNCNRSYSYNPSTTQTQQTQMYARGPGASAGNTLSPNSYSASRAQSDAKASNRADLTHSDRHSQRVEASNNSNNTSNPTNTFNPTNTSNPTNTFNPTFTPTVVVSPNIVVSPQTVHGNGTNSARDFGQAAPAIPVSFNSPAPPPIPLSSSDSAESEGASRLAYEREREAGNLENLRSVVKEEQARLSQQQQNIQSREAEVRSQQQAMNALKNELNEQRNQAAAEARVAQQEISAVRERLTQELKRVELERQLLAEQAAELAEMRRLAEVSRQTDQAQELRQKLDPAVIQGVTGDEPPPPPTRSATPGLETSIYRPGIQAIEKRDMGVRSLIAANVSALDTRQAVAGTATDRARMLASSTPFRPTHDSGAGMSIAAFDALKNGRAPSERLAVVRNPAPFLGGAPASLVDRALSEEGTPLLAVYVPR
jgi:hypothetical protein